MDCYRFLLISMNVYGFRECTRPECNTTSQNAIHPPRMQFHQGICNKPWTQTLNPWNSYVFQYISMDFYRFLWISMNVYGFRECTRPECNTTSQNAIHPPRMQFHQGICNKPWTQTLNPWNSYVFQYISMDFYRFLWISMNVYGFRECTRPECTTPSQNAIHPPRMQFNQGICLKPWTQFSPWNFGYIIFEESWI